MPLLPVVPELVSDETLKRARTTITEGGEEKDAIRVTSIGGNGNLDSQGVADAMGKSASVVMTGSVLNNLERIEAYTDAISRDTVGIDSNVGSMEYALTHDIYDKLDYSESHLTNIKLTVGAQNDSAWSGTGNGSLNAVAKRTSNDAHAAAEVLGTTSDASVSTDYNGTISGRIKHISGSAYNTRIKTEVIAANFGTTTASPWTGSGGATLIAINKRTSNDTNATATATGTQSDTAWSGTGDGTVIALLKGIYNKL